MPKPAMRGRVARALKSGQARNPFFSGPINLSNDSLFCHAQSSQVTLSDAIAQEYGGRSDHA